MKSNYCALCLIYDCQWHIKESVAIQHRVHYCSIKQQLRPIEHINKIAQILENYQLFNQT